MFGFAEPGSDSGWGIYVAEWGGPHCHLQQTHILGLDPLNALARLIRFIIGQFSELHSEVDEVDQADNRFATGHFIESTNDEADQVD